MEISPLKRYPAPNFPSREILDDHPELLRRLPNRWRQSAVVGAALVAACGIVAARWQTAPAQAAEPVSKVAPIFQHGDGHGGFGCVAVNPPVLLSEDEARQIIDEEFKRRGVTFVADRYQLPEMQIPVTRVTGPVDQSQSQTGTLRLDGFDKKNLIGYEYISFTDFDNWRPPDDKPEMSVSLFAIREAAERLRNELVPYHPQGFYGVLYDPCASYQHKFMYLYTERPDGVWVSASLFSQCEEVSVRSNEADAVTLYGDHTITFYDNSTQAVVDGRQVDLADNTVFFGGTLYIPLVWTAKTLGGMAAWDGTRHEAVLKMQEDGPEYRFPLEKITRTTKNSSRDEDIADVKLRMDIGQAISRHELRRQVRDFIAWLKAEGVI